MRTLLLTAAVIAPAAAHAEGQVKRFPDWLVACDNLRTCSAFGFEARDNPNGAYVCIIRAGDADARPAVTFAADPGDDVKAPRLRLTLTGQETGGVPAGPLAAPGGEAALDDAQVDDFLAALATAKVLQVAVLDGTKRAGGGTVSLSGATAALRFMDAEQQRAGGITALVARGAASAGDVPAVPPLPAIAAQPVAAIAPPPAPPSGVRPSADCATGPGADDALRAFRLSNALTLWAACENWGAYNADYRMFVAGAGAVTKLTVSGFDVPGQPLRPDSRGVLTWPTLADDGMTITSITKDEGLGDCGVASDWVRDGAALRLSGLRAMPVCRGVDSGHWPVVFRAGRK